MAEYSGGKKGFIIKVRPRQYRMTDQQRKLKTIADECGIQKGITKKELQQRMVDCVEPRMRGENEKQGKSFFLADP